MAIKYPEMSRQGGDGGSPWLARYPKCVPHTLDYPEFPVWGFLRDASIRCPKRVACRYYAQEMTYEQLEESARKCAAMLVGMGVKPGDRVGLLLPNIPEYLVAAYGIWMAGGVVVALSPLMVPEEVSDLIRVTNCRTVITLDLLLRLVCDQQDQLDHVLVTSLKDRLPGWERLGYAFLRFQKIGLMSPCESSKTVDFNRAVAETTPLAEPISISRDDPAYILSTGGTTGHPKAVVLTHRNLVANAWQLFHWAGQRYAQDVVLAVLPFFHSYGLTTCVTSGVAMGTTLVMHHRFQLKRVVQLIEDRKPTIFYAVPAMLRTLNQHMRKSPADMSSIRWCISGGASLDADVAAEFAELAHAEVVEGYGLSEASPVTHVGPLDGTNRLGTIGLPLPDTEVRIVDAETGERDVPFGEVGELLIRGPQVMSGYWQDPERTAETIRDGWLFTGDLAKCDNGFFQIVDRKKDLIITSGFNVYPNDVEFVLKQFPGVRDAIVVGVPESEHGEIVKAILVFDRGKKFNRKDFEHFTGEHLAKHKRPRLVEVMTEDFPRNFLGKVLRRQLRERSAKDVIKSMTPVPESA